MSNGPRLDVLTGLLKSAASAESVDRLAELIRQFQNAVWSSERLTGSSQAQEEILRDLAYDLDFFVANERNRNEDPSYFGPEHAKSLIVAGLQALNDVAA